jgi:hypothetical protein
MRRGGRRPDRRSSLVVTVASSFVANVPVRFAFESINRLEDWPRMNPACRRVVVLAREGLRTDFRFCSRDGGEWTSSHYAAPDGSFSFTEQRAPQPPLAALQFVRRYAAIGEHSALVAEEVTAALLAGRERGARQAARTIAEHAARVQPVLKAYLEASYLAAGNSGPAGAVYATPAAGAGAR